MIYETKFIKIEITLDVTFLYEIKLITFINNKTSVVLSRVSYGYRFLITTVLWK